MRTIAVVATILALVGGVWAVDAKAEDPVDFTLSSAVDKSKFVLSENRDKVVVLHFLLKTPASTPSICDVGGASPPVASPPVATHANLGLVPNVRNMLGVLKRAAE